jgi:uncharacterized protein
MTTGTTDNVALVRDLYDAFARRDIDAILAALAPDAVIEQTSLLPWGGRHRGAEGFGVFAGRLLAHLDVTLEVGEFVSAGDHVVEIGHSRGRVVATGADYRAREVHVWEIRDGKVAGFHAYVDTPAMLAALNGTANGEGSDADSR